jgi:hypothetical protein
MIYLLTAIVLSPGDSITVHIYTQTPSGSSKVHINVQTILTTIQNKQYIEQHNNFGRAWGVPRLGYLYPGICLKPRKNKEKTQ